MIWVTHFQVFYWTLASFSVGVLACALFIFLMVRRRP